MAAVIGRTQGYTKDGSPKGGEATRLGGGSVRSEANTWRTFAKVTMFADGSGIVEIKQNDVSIHRFAWGSENVNGTTKP